MDDQNRVVYPDAHIEYEDADGRTGRVHIEVVSGNYREPAVQARAGTGFAMHADGPAESGLLRSLGLDNENGSRFSGPVDCDPTAVEL